MTPPARDPTWYPIGLVQRALDELAADPAYAGVTGWQVVLPGAVFVHPHSPGTPAPAADTDAWLATCAARGDGVVRMSERRAVEGGWSARVLAGRCPCGLGFRTDVQVIPPG